MYGRHEKLFQNEFRVVAISPRYYRPTMSSVESRDFIDAEYLEGEQARRDRVPQSACPYSADDPSSHNWRRGWMGARLAEVETRLLLASLKRAGLTVPRGKIEQLNSEHRLELVDWLETAKDHAALAFNRPNWVRFDQRDSLDASQDATAGLQPISFEIEFPLPCPDDEQADSQELPRLREEPPATREESLLQDLLRQFDDVGVQLVEEQWQSLSSDDQDAAIDWLNKRLDGQTPKLPLSLFEFAMPGLRGEHSRS